MVLLRQVQDVRQGTDQKRLPLSVTNIYQANPRLVLSHKSKEATVYVLTLMSNAKIQCLFAWLRLTEKVEHAT